MGPPRYFVPRPNAAHPSPAPADRIAQVLDTFRLRTRNGDEREWLVGLDGSGGLTCVPLEARNALPPRALTQLSHHEIALGDRPRVIAAEEIFILDVQVVEQPHDSELNGPIYLYGTLGGPYGGDDPPAIQEGQLTASRADLLAGLVDGATHSFRYPAARGLHAALPGARVDEIEAGRGLVLAYPLAAAELGGDAGNEAVVAGLFADLLADLAADLERSGTPLAQAIPVANRAALEKQLTREGWIVKGDRAQRRPALRAGWRRVFGWLFAGFARERRTLPPEGKLDEFVELARIALAALPGWPDSRARVLMNRLGGAAPLHQPERPIPRAVPAPPSTAPPAQPVAVPPRIRRVARPGAGNVPDWMQDFIAGHRSTRPTQAKPRGEGDSGVRQSTADRPDWMKDFD